MTNITNPYGEHATSTFQFQQLSLEHTTVKVKECTS